MATTGLKFRPACLKVRLPQRSASHASTRPHRLAAPAPGCRCGRRSRDVSLPTAILVPTPVAVKNAGMPAPAARMRSARVPCGTISSSILPARYSVSNTTGSETARERADDLADAAEFHQPRQADMADAGVIAGDRQVRGALLDQPVDQRVGLADGAKAAEQTVEPSLMPAIASAMAWTILLIMRVGASRGWWCVFSAGVGGGTSPGAGGGQRRQRGWLEQTGGLIHL